GGGRAPGGGRPPRAGPGARGAAAPSAPGRTPPPATRYAPPAMVHRGSFRIASRARAWEASQDPHLRSARRLERLLDSLRLQIQAGDTTVRARRVFETPREIFRLEIESPGLGYLRTTLLDRDALDELLEVDAVRTRLRLDGV